MKKILIIAAASLAIVSAKAAAVDWKVTGAAATEGYSVYVLTSLASSYESADAIAAAAVGSGTITKSGRTYATTGTAKGASVTATTMAEAYFVLIESSTASSYTYYKTDMYALVYDPDNQESSPGTFGADAATMLSSGTSANFQSVPEPTSGLLMLLGMAGLALRRRRA